MAPGASDIRHLRTFLAVAEVGSFTGAATQLHLTQQAVSIHIKRLEADLGVELLFRTTRSVSLTKAGHRFASEAGDLLGHLDDLWQRTADSRSHRGTVRIGITAAAAHEIAPDLVELVGRDHQEIEVLLAEMNPIDVFAGIDDGHLDLGMTLEPPEDHGLSGILLDTGMLAPLVARSLDPDGNRRFETEDLRSMTLYIPNPDTHPHFHQCGIRFAAHEGVARTTTTMSTTALPKSVFVGTAFALWPTVLPQQFIPAGLTVVDYRDIGERVGLWLSFRPERVERAVTEVITAARRLIRHELSGTSDQIQKPPSTAISAAVT